MRAVTVQPLVVALALEWFRASGERTPERLDSLVEHFSVTNGYPAEEARTAFKAEARKVAFPTA